MPTPSQVLEADQRAEAVVKAQLLEAAGTIQGLQAKLQVEAEAKASALADLAAERICARVEARKAKDTEEKFHQSREDARQNVAALEEKNVQLASQIEAGGGAGEWAAKYKTLEKEYQSLEPTSVERPRTQARPTRLRERPRQPG